ncbi:hypothetical protein ASPCADRAFT_135696 [Aspergillus carbonarius ITEM 5010]|uniref:Uncharacterized protein n=1 Tax=Aspergillus carbonarius (strain ITEM 5010) TaxID=602072 RepID=A0A1R3R5M5_ASPC5|nr:hypothetical protein ASPCADRAFT_135696 [Aspergillus carbonarius ITEM 5010]
MAACGGSVSFLHINKNTSTTTAPTTQAERMLKKLPDSPEGGSVRGIPTLGLDHHPDRPGHHPPPIPSALVATSTGVIPSMKPCKTPARLTCWLWYAGHPSACARACT